MVKNGKRKKFGRDIYQGYLNYVRFIWYRKTNPKDLGSCTIAMDQCSLVNLLMELQTAQAILYSPTDHITMEPWLTTRLRLKRASLSQINWLTEEVLRIICFRAMQIKRVGFISLKANIINIKRKEEYLNGSKINMTI